MKNKIITLNADTYTVISPLGKGGQASVWKVRRHRDDKELAMKSVLTAKKDSKGHTDHLTQAVVNGLGKRLQSEIDFIQSLPNTRTRFIVPCLDAGHIEDARYGQLPTWVMPLYKQTLGDKMPPYPKDQPIPVLFSECLKWIEQAAIALEATHSFRADNSRFVHRDVKAANLMLTTKDDIRLIDFGIVHETNLDEETGTHSYSAESAAPEQVLPIRINAGKSIYAIGTHTDMYALGSVFYYLFSGMQSEAQQKLAQKSLYDQHIKMLDNDNTGWVGTLGGLTEAEYDELVNQLDFRFEEEYTDPDASLISVTSGMLQNSEYIPRSVANFIRALLDPVAVKRPSAVQMRLWCQSIKEALSPELSELRLSCDQEDIAAHSSITISLSLIGKGLPANADWVDISVNGEAIYTGFKPLSQDKHYFGFIKSEQTSWEFEVESPEKVRYLELEAKALVGDRVVKDTLKIKINETADDFWQQGKHQQALCLELREAWLDELYQGCRSFLAATRYSKLLTALKACQPKQLVLIEQYQQKLEQKFNPEASSSVSPTTKSVVEPPPRSKKSEPTTKVANNQAAKIDPQFETASVTSPANDKKTADNEEPAAKSATLKYLLGAVMALSFAGAAGYFLLKPKPTPDPAPLDNTITGGGSGGYRPSVPSLPVNNPKKNEGVDDVVTPITPPSKPVVVTVPPTPKPAPQTKAEKELIELKAALNGSNQQARKKAWQRLTQLSKTTDGHQAKTIVSIFVKQTFTLARSSNKQYQKQSFERLQLIASSGDKSVLKSLGQAYYKGIGTNKNWGASWRQLKQANATQEKNKLEGDADTILHSKKSTQKQRNLAYQAAEITARNEAPGDPSQKWMVYRYQIGDGVAVDKAKAKFWQDVYDGKRRLTPMIGEQW
ncbi:MAG: protein kinase [Cocleimonas sp.]|nr:protein kinase [Cocleimonas sp.]